MAIFGLPWRFMRKAFGANAFKTPNATGQPVPRPALPQNAGGCRWPRAAHKIAPNGARFSRHVVLLARLHGTVETVPYKAAESSQFSMEPIGRFVGAGHAPPATKRQREPNGKTGMGEQCSPLQEPIGLRAE